MAVICSRINFLFLFLYLSPKFDPHFEFDTPALQDRAMKAENRLSATTTLTVNVMDSDDLDPVFEHDLYNAKVTTALALQNLSTLAL